MQFLGFKFERLRYYCRNTEYALARSQQSRSYKQSFDNYAGGGLLKNIYFLVKISNNNVSIVSEKDIIHLILAIRVVTLSFPLVKNSNLKSSNLLLSYEIISFSLQKLSLSL